METEEADPAEKLQDAVDRWVRQAIANLPHVAAAEIRGRVLRVDGIHLRISGMPAPVGSRLVVHPRSGASLEAVVVAVDEGAILAAPLGEVRGIASGDLVRLAQTVPRVPWGPGLLGRVLDALGRPLDGRPNPPLTPWRSPEHRSVLATERPPIRQALASGIRVVDGLLTIGRGQRVGIFSGAGVGKSTLLAMFARHSDADVNVIALVGERGREVNEFLQEVLGQEGLQRSVVVVATSDEPAVRRIQAALTAVTLAEAFCDSGRHVLLVMDSLTRVAQAQRELGLAAGEPPATRGFPPSVYSLLPRLLERAGPRRQGAITGIYTILVEGDDLNEPVSDTARGLLDGHLVLSRDLANQGHYPAVDVLQSNSRLMPALASTRQLEDARAVRQALAALHEYRDLIAIGAYQPGTSPQVDAARRAEKLIQAFLRQDLKEFTPPSETLARLAQLAQQCRSGASAPPSASPTGPAARQAQP